MEFILLINFKIIGILTLLMSRTNDCGNIGNFNRIFPFILTISVVFRSSLKFTLNSEHEKSVTSAFLR